jgi:hypothetical protein
MHGATIKKAALQCFSLSFPLINATLAGKFHCAAEQQASLLHN